MKPCLQEYLLASSVEQRVKYADRLYVYGKDRVELSIRQSEMLSNIMVTFSLFLWRLKLLIIKTIRHAMTDTMHSLQRPHGNAPSQ